MKNNQTIHHKWQIYEELSEDVSIFAKNLEQLQNFTVPLNLDCPYWFVSPCDKYKVRFVESKLCYTDKGIYQDYLFKIYEEIDLGFYGGVAIREEQFRDMEEVEQWYEQTVINHRK